MLKYFISREFFLTLIGLIAMAVLGYMIVFFVFLPLYTRHGSSVLVPDVSEVTHEMAMEQLDGAGLRSEVRDCTYIADVPPLTVISQYPVPLSRVKPSRKVFLTLNQAQPPMVKLPAVTDHSLFQAKSRLESWKLGVGTVTRVPDIAENIVLRITYKGRPIAAGTPVPQGAKIDLVVGDGLTRATKMEVPYLIGMTYEEALGELRLLNLGLGSIVYNPNGPIDSYGTIYRQKPSPSSGDSVRMGYPIDLYIYGEEPEASEGEIVDDDN